MTAHLPPRPFTRAELADLGLTRDQVRDAIRLGDVTHPFHGVYLPSHLGERVEHRAAALGRVVSSAHVVCDRTAAWLHGIDAYSLGELTQPPPIEVSALRGHTPSRATGAVAHRRDLLPEDIEQIGRLRVTTPLRTALDLGCFLYRREAMGVLDAFARLHPAASQAALARELERFKGRRGVKQLRELVPLIDPKAESARESWTRLEIIDEGLPVPVSQYWIVVDGVRIFRLDHAYPLARVAVEYNGFEAHQRTPEQVERDAFRREWLTDHRWTVVEIGDGDFSGQRRERWLGELCEALAPAYSSLRWKGYRRWAG